MIYRKADRLCRKLRHSQPWKSGQLGQTFLQQLPLKLGGSERDNYSQLGYNFWGSNFPTSCREVKERLHWKCVPSWDSFRGCRWPGAGIEIPDKLSGIITRKDAGKSWANLAQLFYNNFRPSWAEVSVEIRPMMGLIPSAVTLSHHGTKLKSLAKLARLLTEAGLLTCGQLGHKLKNGTQVDHHFRWLNNNSVQIGMK